MSIIGEVDLQLLATRFTSIGIKPFLSFAKESPIVYSPRLYQTQDVQWHESRT